MQAELYKAHPLESEDTSCLTAETENGVRIYFYATLCAETSHDPVMWVIGSQGSATWRFPSNLFYEVQEGSTGKRTREVIDLGIGPPGDGLLRHGLPTIAACHRDDGARERGAARYPPLSSDGSMPR